VKIIRRVIAFFRKDGPLNRVLLNTGYLFSSNTVGMFISAVQSILIARMIGVLGVGLVANITKFTTNTNQLVSFRMGELVVSYGGQHLKQGETKKAGAVLRSAAVIEALTAGLKFVIVVTFAPLIARFVVRQPELTPLFIFYAYSLFANLTAQTSTAALEIFNRFDLLAVLNVVQNVLSFVVVAVAFFTDGTIVDVVTAYLIAKVFNGSALLVFSLLYARRHLGAGWLWSRERAEIEGRAFWRFAISSNLSATVKLVAQDSEELWISYLLSPLAAGYYNTAMKVIALVLLPINPFIKPTYLEITTQAAQKQWQNLKEVLRKTTTIAGVWTLSVVAVMAGLGWWLIPLAYGPEFAPSNGIALILLVGFGLANTLYWNRPLLLTLDRPVYPLVVATIAMVVKVGLSLWLVPRFGIMMQAGLLSAFLVVTVGLNAWEGVRTVRAREKLPAIDEAAA
jgi:O-antigen/teichoic acid export membrane protein